MKYRVYRKPKPDWKFVRDPNRISQTQIEKAIRAIHGQYPGLRLHSKPTDNQGRRWIDIERVLNRHHIASIQLCVENPYQSRFQILENSRRKHPLSIAETGLFAIPENLNPGHKSPYFIPYRHGATSEYMRILSLCPKEAQAAMDLMYSLHPGIAAIWHTEYLKGLLTD